MIEKKEKMGGGRRREASSFGKVGLADNISYLVTIYGVNKQQNRDRGHVRSKTKKTQWRSAAVNVGVSRAKRGINKARQPLQKEDGAGDPQRTFRKILG